MNNAFTRLARRSWDRTVVQYNAWRDPKAAEVAVLAGAAFGITAVHAALTGTTFGSQYWWSPILMGAPLPLEVAGVLFANRLVESRHTGILPRCLQPRNA